MKVVILNPTLPAYKKDFFEALNNTLHKKEIELSVIHGKNFFKKTVKSDTDPNYSAIPLKALEVNFFSFRITWWKGIFQQIRKIKPDTVIINFNTGNIALWIVQLYCYINKINIGIWSCGFIREEMIGIRRRIRRLFVNFFLFRADFHICYGTKYKGDLLTLGIEESRVFVAQNTLNIERILALDFDKTLNISNDTMSH
ncbi:unnamed protein product [marine sediment metagenome]|uniref:Glycosyltransferase subfamily 4-like N-terminal domain-containing protein n=1 Tax=marine sediment metagenome TaxID=412755 RepID=X1I812_9ZZZZ